MGNSHIITFDNWRDIAETWKGGLSEQQVFDNIIENILVVVTDGEKGFIPTSFKFAPSLTYTECSKIARDMTKEVNPKMDDIKIMQTVFRAAL
jgi:hypothetical protein